MSITLSERDLSGLRAEWFAASPSFTMRFWLFALIEVETPCVAASLPEVHKVSCRPNHVPMGPTG